MKTLVVEYPAVLDVEEGGQRYTIRVWRDVEIELPEFTGELSAGRVRDPISKLDSRFYQVDGGSILRKKEGFLSELADRSRDWHPYTRFGLRSPLHAAIHDRLPAGCEVVADRSAEQEDTMRRTAASMLVDGEDVYVPIREPHVVYGYLNGSGARKLEYVSWPFSNQTLGKETFRLDQIRLAEQLIRRTPDPRFRHLSGLGMIVELDGGMVLRHDPDEIEAVDAVRGLLLNQVRSFTGPLREDWIKLGRMHRMWHEDPLMPSEGLLELARSVHDRVKLDSSLPSFSVKEKTEASLLRYELSRLAPGPVFGASR